MSSPGYPSTWLPSGRARFRFAFQSHCSSEARIRVSHGLAVCRRSWCCHHRCSNLRSRVARVDAMLRHLLGALSKEPVYLRSIASSCRITSPGTPFSGTSIPRKANTIPDRRLGTFKPSRASVVTDRLLTFATTGQCFHAKTGSAEFQTIRVLSYCAKIPMIWRNAIYYSISVGVGLHAGIQRSFGDKVPCRIV
jgi:hypothetical protein